MRIRTLVYEKKNIVQFIFFRTLLCEVGYQKKLRNFCTSRQNSSINDIIENNKQQWTAGNNHLCKILNLLKYYGLSFFIFMLKKTIHMSWKTRGGGVEVGGVPWEWITNGNLYSSTSSKYTSKFSYNYKKLRIWKDNS